MITKKIGLRLTEMFLFMAAMLLLVLATGGENTQGRTITVDDDGGADYEKIQDAIDAAEEGDTIRVYEGTYYENVVVDEIVNLMGNGSENTTIDAEGSGRVVQITADWVNISGFRVMNGHFGIRLEQDSDNNTITNNTCEDNYYHGIHLYKSDDNTLSNNTCSKHREIGIHLYYSQRNNITGNTCEDNNDGGGISLSHSNYNMLTNNTCLNNDYYGISLDSSNSNTIFDNICEDNYYDGISLCDSSNSNISNNMIDSGIFIEGDSSGHWNTHNISSSNTVNGKPIYYYKNRSDVRTSAGAGQLIFASCTGVIVENLCMSNGSTGVLCGYSSDITISNNSFANYSHGVFLYKASSSMLINNTIMCNGEGVSFKDSNKNTLLNNQITENEIGICLTGSSQGNSAHHNTIYGNTNYGIKTGYKSPINAINNWWSHVSGPYHSSNNPEGKGDEIGYYVEFKPWLKWPPFEDYVSPKVFIDTADPTDAFKGEEVDLLGHGLAYESVVRYVWSSSIDGELFNDTNCNFVTTTLSDGVHTIYLTAQDNYGVWSERDSISVEIILFEITISLNNITDPIEPGTKVMISGEIAVEPDQQISSVTLSYAEDLSKYKTIRVNSKNSIQVVSGAHVCGLQYIVEEVEHEKSIISIVIEIRGSDGKTVHIFHKSLEEIYGLRIGDVGVPVAIDDADRDGTFSAGDRIFVKDAAQGGLFTATSDYKNFSLTLYDHDHKILFYQSPSSISYTLEDITDSEGTFSYEFPLPEGMPEGRHEINITVKLANGQEKVEGTYLVYEGTEDGGSQSVIEEWGAAILVAIVLVILLCLAGPMFFPGLRRPKSEKETQEPQNQHLETEPAPMNGKEATFPLREESKMGCEEEH